MAADPAVLSPVTVIAITPQQGATLPEYVLPFNVQSASSEDFERLQVLDVSDYMNRRLTGVSINAAQGNPLQPDLQFRGFTATPLLGGSVGISVYVDGVRVNEIFGDTVNWDLIPEEAMSSMTLVSGANPVFGLNTLGGAIQIQTKNGFTSLGEGGAARRGGQAEAYAGSFGRSEVTLESGGNDGRWGYYVLANRFKERGWRDLSPSDARSILGTLSWRDGPGSIDLHLSHTETDLIGNGPQSVQALASSRSSVFTAPDQTRNNFTGFTVQAVYRAIEWGSLSATLFAREVNTRSYNGDVTDFEPCVADPAVRCDAGDRVLDQRGAAIPVNFDAVNNRGLRRQRGVGGSVQAVFTQSVAGLSNQLVGGFDWNRGRVDYGSFLEASFLVPYIGNPQFTQRTQPGTDIVIPDAALGVHIGTYHTGLYVTDTLSATDRLALTASLRHDQSRTAIVDTLGNNPDLAGRHSFHRLNPALGLTYQLRGAVNLYVGYSESTRAPTPVELTCASPDAPCKLPNNFLADPELHRVIARSVEWGLRGNQGTSGGSKVRWHAGLFRTVNANDIIFQTTGGAQSNEGFFANVGDTRRQGVEASIDSSALDGQLSWYANYTLLDATYRTAFRETSVNNPNADPETGLIQVRNGSRIPGLPRSTFKLGADMR